VYTPRTHLFVCFFNSGGEFLAMSFLRFAE
jgi:hypothetical protein